MKEQLDGGNTNRARTRQGMVSAAVVGLIAAVLIVGPHLFDGDADNITTKAPAAAPPTSSVETSAVDPHANPCPTQPLPVSQPSRADKTLPADVVMVRLCEAKVGAVSSAFEAPSEGLVSDVDTFLAQVARLPGTPASLCHRVRMTPAPFALQLTDSAGKTRTLSTPLTHCGTVTVNHHSVAADALLKLFREALQQQLESR